MTQPEYSTDAERAAAIAGYVAGERFPRGDLAALRRMAPGANPAPAFYRIAARFGLFGPPAQEAAWALAIHGIALMTRTTGSDRSAHDPRVPIGRALYRGATGGERAVYSENRLDRLLAARGATLESLVARLCRTLAREGVSFDWGEMATFILTSGGPRGEIARRRIAFNYDGAEALAEARSTQDKETTA